MLRFGSVEEVYLPPRSKRGVTWKGEEPLYWRLLKVLLISDIILGLSFTFSIPFWAQKYPDSLHTSIVSIHPGGKYYLRPIVGWYEPGWLFIFIAIVALQWCVVLIKREEVETR
jgi:hypothetical protein